MKLTKVESPAIDERYLLEILQNLNKPLRMDAILRAASWPRKSKKQLEALLLELANMGDVIRLPGGYWCPAARMESIEGIFHAKQDGSGVVIQRHKPGNRGREVLVHRLQAGGAWHNDLVRVLVFPRSVPPQGRIVSIIERGQRDIFARVIHKKGMNILCSPVDRKLPADFQVRIERRALAAQIHDGTLVSVRPLKQQAPNIWDATLINIHGKENSVELQEAIVKSSHAVPGSFPDATLAAAARLPQSPDEGSLARRMDLRHIPFVTIDGADARDFDDAVHVEKTAKGWILRVAIADVSHYVRPDRREDSLDSEALKRGNSWYFPRSVEPMLPQALSNGLCSLRPDEDRLAMMVEMPFASNGTPLKPEFGLIVMRSSARLVYEDVSRYFADLDSGSSAQKPLHHTFANKTVADMLAEAYHLYKILAARRRERGTLDFSLPEPAYEFDANGALSHMGFAASGEANHLIEEFMIAANEAVAQFLGEQGASFLYRVHPAPDVTKMQTLLDTLKSIAPNVIPSGMDAVKLANPLNMQKILLKAKGLPVEYAVSRLCLRSMCQARYQTENTGHFGLASPAYCHFTSPIRRYADLTVHRVLKSVLGIEGSKPSKSADLDAIGEELNKLEREAMDCEREMARRLACIALKKHEGEVLAGTISGVTDFGLFVEFEILPAEGLIPVRQLGDEWFELDQAKQRLTGVRTGQYWQLGQRVRVRVVTVDEDKLETKLSPVDMPARRAKKSGGTKKISPKAARSNKVGKNATRKKSSTPDAQKMAAKKTAPISKGKPATKRRRQG